MAGGFNRAAIPFPSMDELLSQMAEDQKYVETLQHWLDEQIP
jgi:hypothetical protein